MKNTFLTLFNFLMSLQTKANSTLDTTTLSQKDVRFLVPRKYIDQSMNQDIMLMLQYTFYMVLKIDTCNAYSVTDLTVHCNIVLVE